MDDENTVNESGDAGGPPPGWAPVPPHTPGPPPAGTGGDPPPDAGSPPPDAGSPSPGGGYPPPGAGYPPPGAGYPPPGQGYGPQYALPWWAQPPAPPGYPPIPAGVDPGFKDKKLAAGLCGILIGTLGIHKFILGYKNEGLTMLLVSVLGGIVTFGIATLVIQIIGIIEGIMYLTKSDYEFVMTYGVNHKGWF